VEQQVKARLSKEINYWDRRAQDLKDKESAGRKTRLPAGVAQERADKLADRLKMRLEELDKERRIMPSTPQVKGGVLIIPAGLLEKYQGRPAISKDDGADAKAKKKIETLAMQAVMAVERDLGCKPSDVCAHKGIGYDIESKDREGRLRFIEVKGRAKGADKITLTTNELRCAVNTPEQFILAVALIEDDHPCELTYIRNFPFTEPGFGEVATAFKLSDLLKHGEPPA
jgi:hypothetical protein